MTHLPVKEEPNRIEFLDYVRGIAILSVFLFHSLQETFHFSSLRWDGLVRGFAVPNAFLVLLPVSFGWAGVSIFFVVSGFCIHLSFHKQGREWRGFFIRRFFRIYPPYLLAVILFTAIFLLAGLHLFSEKVGWREVATHLFLVHNFDRPSYYAINPAFWTIAIEAQLYLLYPVLLLLVAKLGWRRAMVVVAACELSIAGMNGILATIGGMEQMIDFRIPGYVFGAESWVHWLTVSPLAYWFSWSLGALIADGFLNKRPLPLAKSSFLSWAALAVLSYFLKPLYPFFFTLVAVSTAVAISKVISGFTPKIRVPHFCLKHLRHTGLWSYSIYLLHQPLVAIWFFGFSFLCPGIGSHPFLKFAICLVSWFLIMPLGGLWYRFFESPGIAWGKRIIQKRVGMT